MPVVKPEGNLTVAHCHPVQYYPLPGTSTETKRESEGIEEVLICTKDP